MPGPHPRMPVPDRALVTAYESGLSLAAVAGRYPGVNVRDVRAALARAGKPVRTPGQTTALRTGGRDWDQRYATGESIRSIAVTAGTSPGTVRTWLRARGIATRDMAAAARARALREGRDPVPRRRTPALRDGTRGRAALTQLTRHPDGLTTPQCAALAGEQPGQLILSRYGAVLRGAETAGWVRRAGKTPGRWGQGPAVIWQITEPGRAALTALPHRPARPAAPARALPHPACADRPATTRPGPAATRAQPVKTRNYQGRRPASVPAS